MPSFQLIGLSPGKFADLFELADPQLRACNAQRLFADSNPGYPCRVSLEDAEIGDELLLLPFEHQPANSPYRSSGPIFVRKSALQASLEPDQIPDYVRNRLISVRAYNAAHDMIDAAVCPGTEASSAIRRMFTGAAAAYIHLHNANRGCFSCAVHRV